MTLLEVPAVVDSADDLLPAARKLIDGETAQFEADPQVEVACGPNCNACCEHAVVITAAEHRSIAEAVAELPESTRHRIAERARRILDRVGTEMEVDSASISGFDADFSRRYYRLAEPCPLLIDGRCSVRAVRPLVCREYLMSSPPAACDDRSLEKVVRIRRRRRVSGAFGEIAADFGDADRLLLPVALLGSPPLPSRRRRSGPKLAVAMSRPRR